MVATVTLGNLLKDVGVSQVCSSSVKNENFMSVEILKKLMMASFVTLNVLEKISL